MSIFSECSSNEVMISHSGKEQNAQEKHKSTTDNCFVYSMIRGNVFEQEQGGGRCGQNLGHESTILPRK